MDEGLTVDAMALRDEVKAKYRNVAVDPHGTYHFHTGRPLARRLGYEKPWWIGCRTARSRHLPASATRFPKGL